jgi:hypothetical protein
VQAQSEKVNLPYLAGRAWMEAEILAGREPRRFQTLAIDLTSLDETLRTRATAIAEAVVLPTDPSGPYDNVEVPATGIDPNTYGSEDAEGIPDFDDRMDTPIVERIGDYPELPEPTNDPEELIDAWEGWLERYRDLSLDALRRWVERFHPGENEEEESSSNKEWWQATITYGVADEAGRRNRSITFDGLRDLELMQRVRGATALGRSVEKQTDHADQIAASQAVGPVLTLEHKPTDREDLIAAYEDHTARWCAVARAARANRLRRRGAFEREMRRWAEEHGSERLKLGLADGYRMTAVYLEERLASEFPGFYAWFSRAPEHARKARIGPSEEALKGRREVQMKLDRLREERGESLRAEVVWVTDPPLEMMHGWWDREEVPFEAVVVEGWLGRYTLIGPIASEQAPLPRALRWEPVFGDPSWREAEPDVDDIPF